MNKEDRLKKLKSYYSTEHQKIYKKYTEEKNTLSKILKQDSDLAMKRIEESWKIKKADIKSETDKLWNNYNQKLQQRQQEKKTERKNLQNFIDSYNKEQGSTPPEKRAGPSTFIQSLQKSMEQSNYPSSNKIKKQAADHADRYSSKKEATTPKPPKPGGGKDRDR